MGKLLCLFLALAAQEKAVDRRGCTLEDVNLQDLTLHVQKITGKTILWTDELGLKTRRAHYVTDRPIGDDPVLLFKAYQHILQWNDLLLVPAGKEGEEVYKLTMLAAGMKKPIPVVRAGTDPSERFVTRIFPLQHATPRALWPILSTLVSSPQHVQPVDESSVLLVTDYDSNLRRLEEIIKILDVKKPDLEMKMIPLKHASAAKVEEKMNALVQTLITRSPSARGVPVSGVPGAEPAKVVSDDRTNSIILLAEPSRLTQLEGHRPPPRRRGAV
jgi:general secretion pathway protein D